MNRLNLTRVFDNMFDMIIVTLTDGRIVYANPSALKFPEPRLN